MQDDELTTIEESFDEIPKEVQEYIYSDRFNNKLITLFSNLSFTTPDEQTSFKGSLFGYLADVVDDEEFMDAIDTLAKNPLDRERVLTWVDEYVKQAILSIITKTYIAQADDEEVVTEKILNKPSPAPSSVLTSLGARLSQPTVVPPTTRDHSIDSAPAKTFDPYRELPEK